MVRNAKEEVVVMECARAFKGVWIPREIYLADDLSWTEKILLVEIDSLDHEIGCFASNEHFASFLGISKGRVSKNIGTLIDKGYVTSQIIYKKGSRVIDKRILHTTIGSSRERLEGMVENDEENNTMNNTINNTNQKKEKRGLNALIEAYTTNPELIECIKDFIRMRAAKKKPMTDRAMKMLLHQLDELESTDERKIKVLEQSILNSWQGIFPLKDEKGGNHYESSKESYNPFDL